MLTLAATGAFRSDRPTLFGPLAGGDPEPSKPPLAQLCPPASEDPEPGDVHGMGIVAEVMQVLRMPDSTVRVMLDQDPNLRSDDLTAIAVEIFRYAEPRLP